MHTTKFYALLLCCCFISRSKCQHPPRTICTLITVIAGKELKKIKQSTNALGQKPACRWATPVRVRAVMLDTLFGGLTPYLQGGSGESKSLRLRTKDGKIYVLRSINKTRGKTLPPLLKASFYGSLVQDGVSTSHPYAALALPVMLQNANILHTQPQVVYLPNQIALDTFNTAFANDLYLLEERPEGDWSTTPHLGNYKKYLSTEEVKQALQNTTLFKANGAAFIKARLFDLLISDVAATPAIGLGRSRYGHGSLLTNTYRPRPGIFTHDGFIKQFINSGNAAPVVANLWLQH